MNLPLYIFGTFLVVAAGIFTFYAVRSHRKDTE